MAENYKTRDELLEEIQTLKKRVEELESHKGALVRQVEELEGLGDTYGKADQEIIRLERLHALQEMAQGVAHNFNNVLVGVMGYAQIIEMQSEDPRAIRQAKKIVENSLRAKELVQKLNRSVRRAEESPLHRVTSLHTIVQEAVRVTRPKWQDEAGRKGILIEIIEDLDTTPAVRSSPVELHHVLVHLISNAVDAMPEGGEILITTRLLNDMVAIVVKDQGVGMDGETQKRIFEPFFTTRQDVGSGLGLSMVYRTVTDWKGRIEVESEPDGGSTFTVLLPVWQEEVQTMATEEVDESRERVLVIDDEEAVHDVLIEGLADFDLDAVLTGEEALDRFEAGRYSAAIIDLKLPGLMGDELAVKLREIDPDLPTILLTGWDTLDEDLEEGLFDFSIQKPFKLTEIHEILSKIFADRKV